MSNRENIMISVKAWSEIMQNAPASSMEICNAINEVILTLPANEQYVYFATFPFGTKLIENGVIPIDKFSFISNDNFPPKNIRDLNTDLDYSRDPLGLVLKNHIEVYSSNKRDGNIYNVPINIIKEWDFFGLFGALDYLSNRNPTHPLTHEQQWSVVAGNVCFEILFPFDNSGVNTYLYGSIYEHFIRNNQKPNFSEEDKILFVKKHLAATNSQWGVDVIYFHKKFINKLRESPFVFKHILFDIGWTQSGYSRDALFENKIVSDKIEHLNTTFNCTNRIFLSALYYYILRAIRGDAYILYPATSDHILFEANNSFKQALNNAGYISKKSAYHPIILTYEKFNSWGILASAWLPILLEYKLVNASAIRDDLDFIKNRIHNDDSNFVLKHATFSNKIMKSKHDTHKDAKLVPSGMELKEKISDLSGCDSDNVCLTSSTQGLADFLIIEK